MFIKRLNDIKQLGLLRSVRDRTSPAEPPVIEISGRKLVNFSGNDYLGLSAHPELINAACDAASKYGAGAGSARLLSGGISDLHARLESEFAEFAQTEAAVLFNSGFSANAGAIPALAGQGDAIFSDELNHASIIDGCRLSNAEVHVYGHKDMGHLERLLMDSGGSGIRLIVSDTVFSMHGDIAAVDGLHALAEKYDAYLYLDEAHSTGVLGGGRGALAHFNIKPDSRIIRMFTLSKAVGSYGAIVAGPNHAIELLKSTSRSFMFSTALPPSVVAASMAGLGIIQGSEGRGLIEKLWLNRARLVDGLNRIGARIGPSETPIVPVMADNIESALKLSAGLFDAGYYAAAIRPPAVKDPMLRIVVSASHDFHHIDGLIDAVGRLK